MESMPGPRRCPYLNVPRASNIRGGRGCTPRGTGMTNIFHDIDPGMISPESFTVVIEIPKGSKVKYELDKDTGMLRLDRILFTSTHYPANYGFIPRTYADDGDPLDALVLCTETIAPLTLVQCRPIGAIKMVDGGDNDEKIIAVAEGDPDLKDVRCLDDVPKHLIDEMCHFFSVYKTLENKVTEIDGTVGRDEAERIVKDCMDGYGRKYGA